MKHPLYVLCKIDTEIEVEIADVVVDPGEEEENAENLVNYTG